MKKYDKVIEKSGCLKQRYARVSCQYQINIAKAQQTKNVTQRQADYDTSNDLPGDKADIPGYVADGVELFVPGNKNRA